MIRLAAKGEGKESGDIVVKTLINKNYLHLEGQHYNRHH